MFSVQGPRFAWCGLGPGSSESWAVGRRACGHLRSQGRTVGRDADGGCLIDFRAVSGSQQCCAEGQAPCPHLHTGTASPLPTQDCIFNHPELSGNLPDRWDCPVRCFLFSGLLCASVRRFWMPAPWVHGPRCPILHDIKGKA